MVTNHNIIQNVTTMSHDPRRMQSSRSGDQITELLPPSSPSASESIYLDLPVVTTSQVRVTTFFSSFRIIEYILKISVYM